MCSVAKNNARLAKNSCSSSKTLLHLYCGWRLIHFEGYFRRQLTHVEAEVGMLLLKGLRQQEIANIRTSGKRTVRLQARSLHCKVGVSECSSLTAFFWRFTFT